MPDKTHDLVFYANRSTPKVVHSGAEATAKKGYGVVTKRRPANPDEEKVIASGRWLRVDARGNKPSNEGYKITKYRPQLVKKKAEEDLLLKIATQYDQQQEEKKKKRAILSWAAGAAGLSVAGLGAYDHFARGGAGRKALLGRFQNTGRNTNTNSGSSEGPNIDDLLHPSGGGMMRKDAPRTPTGLTEQQKFQNYVEASTLHPDEIRHYRDGGDIRLSNAVISNNPVLAGAEVANTTRSIPAMVHSVGRWGLNKGRKLFGGTAQPPALPGSVLSRLRQLSRGAIPVQSGIYGWEASGPAVDLYGGERFSEENNPVGRNLVRGGIAAGVTMLSATPYGRAAVPLILGSGVMADRAGQNMMTNAANPTDPSGQLGSMADTIQSLLAGGQTETVAGLMKNMMDDNHLASGITRKDSPVMRILRGGQSTEFSNFYQELSDFITRNQNNPELLEGMRDAFRQHNSAQ